jgi:hypothetical protein
VTYYWRLGSIPELRGVPVRDRREWWREAMVHGRRSWLARVMLALTVVVALAVLDLGTSRQHWSLPVRLVAAGGLVGLLGFAIDHWYVQPRARRWLRERLSSCTGESISETA